MSIINEWDAQAELIIHSAWVSDFRNKFTLNKKNI